MFAPSLNTSRKEGAFTRTALGAPGRCVRGVAAACGESVLDVLHALRLVRVREPVLAHVEVVGEAD